MFSLLGHQLLVPNLNPPINVKASAQRLSIQEVDEDWVVEKLCTHHKSLNFLAHVHRNEGGPLTLLSHWI